MEKIFARLKGRGRLSEGDVEQALREIRMALLEADVNLRVADDFIAKIREKAVGQEVLRGISPGQQVVKIVHDHLIELMGSTHKGLNLGTAGRPAVIMLVGLHGSGKTTTCGKLALNLKAANRRPMLVAADLRRPAAVKQLEVVAEKAGVRCFSVPGATDPVVVCKRAVLSALSLGHDAVILDTAGRLHVDDELMEELSRLKRETRPNEVLLVVDAMTGQDGVTVAKAFQERVGIDGVVLTKLDGDARGGVALSVKAVTGKPIKFAGVGEKLDALEPFHPDRMASRILGMGDVVSLVEKAQAAWDAQKQKELERKMRSADWTLEDFVDQLRKVREMGPLNELVAMIPGLAGRLKHAEVQDKELVKVEAIVNSMTKEERKDPSIIDGSRRRRIAAGSGTTVQDVNRVLRQFDDARRLMKQISTMERKGKRVRGGPFVDLRP